MEFSKNLSGTLTHGDSHRDIIVWFHSAYIRIDQMEAGFMLLYGANQRVQCVRANFVWLLQSKFVWDDCSALVLWALVYLYIVMA